MDSFSLIDEKWIPCVDTNGYCEEYGLLETLRRSHQFEEIQDPSPLVTVSLFRLLLAILHRNFGPSSPEQWIALWNEGRWHAKTLEDYFAKWRHRFCLFHENHPFFQTVVPEEEKEHPPQLLSLESAAGNNPTLCDHSTDESGETMQPSKAARYLVARQAFSIGFGKSKPFYLSDSSMIRGLSVFLIGRNLFETLALNLIGYSEHRPMPRQKGKNDVPWWEQERPSAPDRNGTEPIGYLDYLTWQSRRIHLMRDKSSGAVTGCRILQNLKLPDPVPLDPFKCYVNVESKGLVAKRLREDRALWRDYHVLLQTADNSFKRPEVFNWLARVVSLSPTRIAPECQLRIVGLATDSGKAASVIFWRHEILPLPLEYLSNQELVSALKSALTLAEEVGKRLRESAWHLARFALIPDESKEPRKEEKKDISDMCDELSPGRLYWSRLETAFKRLLGDLPNDESTDEYASTVFGARCLPGWAVTIRRAALEAFNVASAAIGESARALKARARAENVFREHLNDVLNPYYGHRNEGGEKA